MHRYCLIPVLVILGLPEFGHAESPFRPSEWAVDTLDMPRKVPSPPKKQEPPASKSTPTKPTKPAKSTKSTNTPESIPTPSEHLPFHEGGGAECWAFPWTGECESFGFFSANVEYLLWFFENEDKVPPLALSNPSAFGFGVVTQGPVQSFQPQLDFEDMPSSGGRVSLGYWLSDNDPTSPYAFFKGSGIEVTAMFLGERTIPFHLDSAELIRPFFDATNSRAAGFLVAAPGVAAGSLSGSVSVDAWGLEANASTNVYNNAPGTSIRLDVLGGYRFFAFDSRLLLQSQTVFAQNLNAFPALTPFAGNRIDIRDQFDTQNDFHGFQVGTRLSFITDLFIGTLSLKGALGNNHQQLRITGKQVRTAANGSQARSVGGLYALPSNIGQFTRDRVSLLYEGNYQISLPVSKHLTIFLGYTLLGWTDVLRPVQQLDQVVNTNQLPNFPARGFNNVGLQRPSVLFRDQSIFIHGINAGVSFIW